MPSPHLKVHPRDEEGKRLISLLHERARALAEFVSVVYVTDYDLALAQLMVSGVDIWVNTPLPPLEASGTSGMKAAFNGVPSLSVLDGWWIEGCIEGVTGWSVEDEASRILNIVHFQTLIASKAARCVLAADGRQLVDFGMRRAHEGDAALYAARAAYLAGFNATATVEAGRRFGIPLSGTMAHSFVEAHEHEVDAFRNFVMHGPGADATVLIDTYDTQRGARRVGLLVQELRKSCRSRRVGAVPRQSDLAWN